MRRSKNKQHAGVAALRCRLKALPLLGLALAAAALALTSASAGTIRDDQPDSLYLALGASAEYASVGRYQDGSGLSGYEGCGTLIAPDWVLTAAHLILSSSGTFTINGTAYGSSQIITEPSWNSGNELAGYDFALVHLSTPVTGVTPATLYTGSLEPQQVGTFVGYGMTGTGLTGYRTADFKKRAYQNVLDQNFDNAALLLGAYFDNPHLAADNPLPLEGCSAPGDSGGGMFITEGSQTYLAGVVSFVASIGGAPNNSVYGNLTGAGRVSAVAPWISTYVPEPSPAALLLLTGFCLLGWQRCALKRSGPSATR